MKIAKILRICDELITEMQVVNPDHNMTLPQILHHLKGLHNPSFNFLKTKYFAIFHSIILGRVTHDNLYILEHMLKQKRKIDKQRLTVQEATDNVSTMLSSEFGLC